MNDTRHLRLPASLGGSHCARRCRTGRNPISRRCEIRTPDEEETHGERDKTRGPGTECPPQRRSDKSWLGRQAPERRNVLRRAEFFGPLAKNNEPRVRCRLVCRPDGPACRLRATTAARNDRVISAAILKKRPSHSGRRVQFPRSRPRPNRDSCDPGRAATPIVRELRWNLSTAARNRRPAHRRAANNAKNDDDLIN